VGLPGDARERLLLRHRFPATPLPIRATCWAARGPICVMAVPMSIPDFIVGLGYTRSDAADLIAAFTAARVAASPEAPRAEASAWLLKAQASPAALADKAARRRSRASWCSRWQCRAPSQ